MATNRELTERVEKLEAELAELREQVDKPAPKPAPKSTSSPKAKTD